MPSRQIKKLVDPAKLPDPEPQVSEEEVAEDPKQAILGNDLIAELKQKYDKNKRIREKREAQQQQNVVWQPHPGPQEQFLASPEYEVLFCGGRGSGKSDCLLVDIVRFVDNKNFRGLIIRRTMPALREIIRRAKDLYPLISPGVKWKEQEKMFVFPSGATLEMGYFDHLDDYDRYHGREFNWIGLDEISLWESREFYDKIKSVARTTSPDLPVRIRATTNPSGPGRIWIKDYFIDAGEDNKPIIDVVETPMGKLKITRKYIKSTVFDNPTIVDKDPNYVAYLASLPEIQRRQWLEGDFDAADGLAFEEFSKEIHVCTPFNIPSSWVKFRAIDWGFRSKAVCVWFAIDYDGNIYIYREYVTTGVHADTFAANVLALEDREYISYGLIDGQVGVQSGITGPTIEEQMLNEGLRSIHADKSKGSRIHGKSLIHMYLRIDSETQQPRLKIFNTCKQTIKELSSLMISKTNPEDIDESMDDHAYDAIRYGLMSRPTPAGDPAFTLATKTPILDSKFGY